MQKSSDLKLHIIIVFMLISGFTGMGQAQPAEPRKLSVSASSVAGSDEKSDKLADYFTQRIGMGRNFEAKRAPDCSWNEVPQGCAAENQVNVFQLKFNNRLELLAIMPDPNNSAVAFAARAPALVQPPMPHGFHAPPGDYQLPENAPNDLVANFAYALEHRSESKGSYQLILKPWEQNKQANNAMAAQNVSFSSKDAEMMKIYPLAAAAMYAENFQACSKQQEAVIVLSFKIAEVDCAIHAALYRDNKKIYELERYGVKYEKLYDSLRILFLNLIEWQGTVLDFSNPGRDAFQPLAVAEIDNEPGALESKKTVLLGKDKTGFAAFDPANGNTPWETSFDKGESGLCRNGQLFLYNAPRFTKISAGSGKKEFSLATAGDLDHLDALRELCVYAVYQKLCLFDKETELWSKSLPCSVQAGPLLTDEGIVLGDAKGEFRCFSLKGEELWKLPLPHSVHGEIYTDGGLFFATDDCGKMFVIDHQGKLVWSAEIGDLMTGPPQIVGNLVVVGSKSGKLFLFDKSTGACLKNYQFKSWLLGCRLVGPKILCVTLDKQLCIFDLARFELEKTLRFPFRFNPEILPLKNFPQRQIQGPISMGERITGCLLSDVKGNVYLYSAEPGGETANKGRSK